MKPTRNSRMAMAAAAGISTLALWASAATFSGSTVESDKDIDFATRGGVDVVGSASGVSATQAGDKLVFKAPVAQMTTDNNLRDKHMRNRLDADAHPTIVLEVPIDQLQVPSDKATAKGSVAATVTVAGEKRPTTLKYTAYRTGSDFHLTGTFRVNIEQHGVKAPCFLGACVDPNVTVTINKYKVHRR